jgi:hypothetical protein
MPRTGGPPGGTYRHTGNPVTGIYYNIIYILFLVHACLQPCTNAEAAAEPSLTAYSAACRQSIASKSSAKKEVVDNTANVQAAKAGQSK